MGGVKLEEASHHLNRTAETAEISMLGANCGASFLVIPPSALGGDSESLATAAIAIATLSKRFHRFPTQTLM